MKKKTLIYFLIPIAALVLFIPFYWNYASHYEGRIAKMEADKEQARKTEIDSQNRMHEQAVKDAIASQEKHKQEKAAKDALTLKNQEEREDAVNARNKAQTEQSRFEEKVNRLKEDVKVAEDEIDKLQADEAVQRQQQGFLDQYVKAAEANSKSLQDVLTKIAAADQAAGRPGRGGRGRRQEILIPTRITQPFYLMKKWMYLIFPGLGLIVFLAIYFPAKHMAEERTAAQAADVERAKQEAADKRKELEDKAKVESDQRAAENAREREAQEKRREDTRLADLQHVRDDTDTANADADRFSKEAEELTAKLAAMQQKKEDLTREDFDLAKKVQARLGNPLRRRSREPAHGGHGRDARRPERHGELAAAADTPN